MKKISKKLFLFLITSAVILNAAIVNVFPELNLSVPVSAEEEITVSDVEELIGSVPKYLNYFNKDVSKKLKNILEYIKKDNLSECTEDELRNYYSTVYGYVKNLTYKTNDVPQVYISTANENGDKITKDTGYVDTEIAVVDTDGTVIYDNAGLIKVRGNSTSAMPKKPYKIKFSSKQDVLGMGKSKKWVLLADCLDPTLLRNHIAFDLAEYMGLEYTSQKRVVELWVDGVYEGCYLLIEPVDTGKTRVNINTDGNNDFLIEYELVRTDDGVTYFNSNNNRFGIKAPENPSEEQVGYIKSVMDNITKKLEEGNYEEIKKLIDVKSFVDYYILNEYFKTVDFGMSSVFFYYKDGILYAGPPWDYDLTSGNLNPHYYKNYEDSGKPDKIYAANYNLYKYLCKCEEFQEEVRAAYNKYQEYIRNIFIGNGAIDQLIEKNRNVYTRNFSNTIWKVSKLYSMFMREPDPDYETNVNYLKNWLAERYEWLCDCWNTDIQYNIAEEFKDNIFGNYISEQFDIDKDGYLSEAEASQVRAINISGMGIYDISGIEFFKNLEDLNCSKNNITKINLSRNTALKRIDCSENKLRYLDLHNNTSITSLNCSNNCLSYIETGKCTGLSAENFNCSNNIYELKCGEYDMYFYFYSISGIDPKKIKDIKGAKYNNNIGNIYEMSDQVSYTYSTGVADVTFYINVMKHDYSEKVLFSEATCTDNEVYIKTCSNCGDEEKIVKDRTALGHKIVHKESKEPECTEKGKKEYWECEVCKAVFSDAKGKNKVYRPEYISALGHDWIYSVNEEKDVITAVCRRDGSHTASLRISAENAVRDGEVHEAVIDSSDWIAEGLAEPAVVYEGDNVNSGVVRADVIIGEGEGAVTASVTYTISSLKGDVSGNGIIDIYDAIEIAKSVIGVRVFSEKENETADFNGDGIANLYDAISIAEYLVRH